MQEHKRLLGSTDAILRKAPGKRQKKLVLPLSAGKRVIGGHSGMHTLGYLGGPIHILWNQPVEQATGETIVIIACLGNAAEIIVYFAKQL